MPTNFNPFIEYIADKASLWQRFPTISGTKELYQAVFNWIQKELPNTLKVYQDIGKDLFRYLDKLYRWVGPQGVFSYSRDRSEGESIAKFLVDNVWILERIEGLPQPPTLLYRALANLDECPRQGQNVVYSPKFPATSWSEVEDISNDYCKAKSPKVGSCGSVLLTVESKELFKHGLPFAYPFHGELKKLGFSEAGKYEFEFYITSIMPVLKWRFC